ncbi:hypothetical protein ILUMI_00369 [Ignelater luminosus]|uniref:Uncharacterized protein n=1 Tax=Ignelater luminosus TaxID=2038154 RepID=A0A8K0DKC7_IGNLU|nr:hypothetical protein ILUMI_00369 [Ignelater luminosus]
MELVLEIILMGGILASAFGETEKYNPLSLNGKVARLDVINALKIALKISNPKPTKVEEDSAVVFIKFLSTPAVDEYLDTFYTATQTTDDTNSILGFLNGFLYDGNPDLPAWRAAEVLVKMIKTKTNLYKIEKLRERAKQISNSRENGRGRGAAIRREMDYLQVFRQRGIYHLGPLLADLRQEDYRSRRM